jgi:hypothetical protein
MTQAIADVTVSYLPSIPPQIQPRYPNMIGMTEGM